jgi:hypothetical protein
MPTKPVPDLPRDFRHTPCQTELRLSFRVARDKRDGKPVEILCPTCGRKAKPAELVEVKPAEFLVEIDAKAEPGADLVKLGEQLEAERKAALVFPEIKGPIEPAEPDLFADEER